MYCRFEFCNILCSLFSFVLKSIINLGSSSSLTHKTFRTWLGLKKPLNRTLICTFDLMNKIILCKFYVKIFDGYSTLWWSFVTKPERLWWVLIFLFPLLFLSPNIIPLSYALFLVSQKSVSLNSKIPPTSSKLSYTFLHNSLRII